MSSNINHNVSSTHLEVSQYSQEPPQKRAQKPIVFIALALFTIGTIALSRYGWRQSVLFLIGGLLGITLYYSSFGFTSAYRKFLFKRDVGGIYAQLLMLAVATVLFAPVLASGTAFGQEVKGSIAPVGVQGAIGALLFGIGMQIASGCGCGTLYTVGSGSLSMIFTVIAFCIGSFWASLNRHLWANLPSIPPVVLGQSLGWTGAVFLQLGVFVILAGLLWVWSTKVHKRIEIPASLLKGAIALAILNFLTLIISGQPWRITWGFALWSAKIATIFGWNPSDTPFWAGKAQQTALSQSVFADITSVMNIGIVLGAFLAAALAGRLIPKTQITPNIIASTLLGGLLMGYGALNAFGCNVNAFFGGIASTSLHGWIWIIFALIGSFIGAKLRPVFGQQM
ncbi:YeeE/YedE family protein [Calothrix sp. NIES-4071]|nr:YeeE/YedE family protein [Calothrix sp. NIES-4071]BAZ56097.1 YeeE/YedE family protein [Calothrix sp. NIES-4105]